MVALKVVLCSGLCIFFLGLLPESSAAECEEGEMARDALCTQYKECVHGRYLTRPCAGGNHFDVDLGMCNWPDAAKCQDEEDGAESALRYAMTEECEEGATIRDALCTQYQQCVHGSYITRPCAGGTHFDVALGMCNWPDAAGCTDQVGPTTKPTTGTTEISTTSTTTGTTSGLTTRTSTTSIGPTTRVTSVGPRSDKKIVCYYTNWSVYRPGAGKFVPDYVLPELCTHIMYSFIVLNPSTYELKIHDPWADTGPTLRLFERVLALKSAGTKVLIALGGWNDSLGGKYSTMVGSAEYRRTFISSVMKFLKKYGFQGLDLDWEYPGCPQGMCSSRYADDKVNFVTLLKELRAAFGSEYLLTAAVSPAKEKINSGYDVPRMVEYLDFINVMTYDFFGAWDKKAGHVSPFRNYPQSLNPEFNTVSAIEFWKQAGAPASKLVLGIPMYGRGVTLDNAANHELGAPGRSPAKAGVFTREAGYSSMYEICDYVLRQNYTVVKDTAGNIGPYIYKQRQWLSYDDWDMAKTKAEYVLSEGLGGAMIWSLALDDFSGEFCKCGKYPLLNVISSVVQGAPVTKPTCKMFQ